MLRALAKEYSYVPFIIPERQAVQPADKAFEGDKIGSGPYVFSEKEWVPGAKTVYLRNKDYVPRSDPPDCYAGARRATVDRVEWVVILDPSTAVAALQKGEVDFIQQPRIDQWPNLRKDPNVTMKKVDVQQMQIHPNHLRRPSTTSRRDRRWRSWSTRRTISRRLPGIRRTGRSAGRSSGAAVARQRDGSEPYQKQDLAKAKQPSRRPATRARRSS